MMLQMEDFMAFEYCFRDVRNKGISNDVVETIEQWFYEIWHGIECSSGIIYKKSHSNDFNWIFDTAHTFNFLCV